MAKIFISTNPILIHDSQKYDSVRLMTKRLLCPETHHELLVYEALLALTNISTCFQGAAGGTQENKFANDMTSITCGTNEDKK